MQPELQQAKRRLSPKVAAAIAAITLGIGYMDLWRGGETVSAVLLTIGYLVLVPVAMVTVSGTTHTRNK